MFLLLAAVLFSTLPFLSPESILSLRGSFSLVCLCGDRDRRKDEGPHFCNPFTAQIQWKSRDLPRLRHPQIVPVFEAPHGAVSTSGFPFDPFSVKSMWPRTGGTTFSIVPSARLTFFTLFFDLVFLHLLLANPHPRRTPPFCSPFFSPHAFHRLTFSRTKKALSALPPRFFFRITTTSFLVLLKVLRFPPPEALS